MCQHLSNNLSQCTLIARINRKGMQVKEKYLKISKIRMIFWCRNIVHWENKIANLGKIKHHISWHFAEVKNMICYVRDFFSTG